MRKTKQPTDPKIALANQYLAALDRGKQGYRDADELFGQLTALAAVGEQIALDANRVAVIVDNFADKTKVWRPCGVSRYDLKVVTKDTGSDGRS